ncbi:MAG: bL35 family ribosomal protein [bacterium]|nr:bL35 family ribosomal protein [bacterium]MDZ4231715.1 bL35 family ribosomal protein [Candidatus Pacearchaeota archaeon]
MARSAKTRKSVSKRFKFTKSGKVMRRASGQDHNLSKKSGRVHRLSKKWVELSKPEAKKMKKALKA